MMLIKNWSECWKFWSLRLGVAGAVLTSIFLAAPEAALHSWALLPDDIKSHMPPEVIKYMGVVILVLSFIARIVKQPKLEAKHDRDSDEDNQA